MSRATAADLPPTEASDEYHPGVCNIGPAEIGRRRMTGHIGLAATVAAIVGLLAVDAPPLARLLVALPAAGAASGYLQARERFCAGFGSAGIYNFGELGQREAVDDPEARERDRRKAREIGVRSALIGAAVGIAAALLPG